MAKDPACESIMGAAKLKPLLALSKHEPVQAAIGLTADAEGVILLDKKAKPRKVMALLHGLAGKAKLNLNAGTLRYGRAEVDPDYDPAMVRFFINKEAPGNMRAKLVEVVRKAGFQKVEFNIDPSIDAEADAEGDETEAQEGTPPASQAAAPPPPPPPPQAPPAPPSLDSHALTAELAALMRQIPAAGASDPELKARLLKLATDANLNIKTNNLAAAAVFIGELRAAIANAPAGGVSETAPSPQSAPGEAGGAAVRLAKGLLLWNSTRSYVASQIARLQQAILDDMENHPEFSDIAANVGNLEEILETLDDSLTETLNELRGTTDAAEKTRLTAQARKIVAGFQAYAAQDPLINAIDDNGFVALDIKPHVEKTLAAILTTI